MTDSHFGAPILERLERLRAYERAWDTLSLAECVEVLPFPFPILPNATRMGFSDNREAAW
jgi:hypothetical protein